MPVLLRLTRPKAVLFEDVKDGFLVRLFERQDFVDNSLWYRPTKYGLGAVPNGDLDFLAQFAVSNRRKNPDNRTERLRNLYPEPLGYVAVLGLNSGFRRSTPFLGHEWYFNYPLNTNLYHIRR